MSDSVRPHRRQPTRLPHPWDSPGNNTGVGCHFLLQCRKVKVKSCSRVRLFATPWTAAYQAPPSMGFSITNSQSSLGLTSIESVMPSSHLILCRPLLLLPPIPPSIRVFSNESALRMRWPKYFSIIPSKEHPGLISFRMDWLDWRISYKTRDLYSLKGKETKETW